MNDYNWYSLETGNAVLSKDRVLNVTKSGKYWVTAEVKHGGCVITDSLDVEFKMPDIELGNDTTVCPDQTVTYALKEGYSKYEWSTSDTHHTTTINVGEGFAEKIEVEVTDEFGCTANDEVLVTAYATPDIQLNRTEVCMGQSVVHVNKFDRYRWEFKGVVLNEDETKDFIIPEESGIYTLTVWNEFGCSQTEDINITVHALPSLSLTDQWECNGEATRIDAPSVAGWNYEWSTGATTSYIDLSAPADFALKVTDDNGCVAESNARFDWYDDPVVNLGDDLSECVGVSVSLVSQAGYSDYEWKYKESEADAGIVLATPSSPDTYVISNAQKDDSGIYIVNILDAHSCPATDTVKVHFYDTNPPVLELERDLCKGEEIEILATTGYDSYVWYRNGMALPAYDDLTAIKVNNDGTYKLEASYLGCIKQNKVTITAYDTPEVKLPDDFSICPGDDIILGIESFTSPSGSALDYFVWDGEEKKIEDINAVKKVDAVGLYGVTAYDEHGCSDSDKVNVSNYSLTVVPDVAPIEACENIGVSLENPITDALSYKWFKVEVDTDVAGPENVNWNVSQSGTYRLSIVDKNGCPSEREQVIKILPVPVVDLGPDVEMCAGESAVLKVPDVFASYQWNNNSLLNKSFLPVSTSGSYQLEVENIEGCSATDTVNVTLHPSPVFDVPDVAVCAGEEVTLNAPAGLSNIKWSTGETSSSIVADRGGYWLEAMSDEGCVTRDTVKVIWYPVPKADLGPDSLICPVDQLQISAGLGFASYLWHNNQTVPTITAALQDTVNQVIVSNEFGCYGFDTKLVRPMSRPDVVLCSDTSVCEKDTFDIIPDVSSFEDDEYVSPEPFSYLWDDGSTEETRQVVEPGEYIVEVTDGCFVFKDTAQVVYEELPIITHIDSTVYGKITVLAEGGTAPYEYILNESDISSDGVFSKLEPGEHIVEVVDANGCKALDSLSLSELVEIEIPPFFTPNGDGINDRFVIKGSERFPDAIIKIYDRYGKLLVKYPASSPGWDGRYEGRPVSTDDYWYVVEFVSSRKILKGHVTLKR
ncbi:T9SS type B sorting domain-containing protein [Saccharicrinis fermentans]|uniref:Ig-like domain-containing protein n=2 Tax=Saccharicrinis fermentans TaxID=982 RepID=W7Y6K8_9BACT|nr:T9SS type B sorting domain-containing protein [Saccharicrinis fermentans]GAF03852.1 hypothetical protein JCM21142_72539 [Saccharicrinis fermentans DSM 9555 = JCM 21142]